MNISSIKKLNEKLPYWIKRPFSKLIRNQLITNKIFLITYHSLLELDTQNETEVFETQKKKLIQELIHAYEHSKYYRNLFNEYNFNPHEITDLKELQRLPVLTKEILKNNLKDIVSDDIKDSYVVTTGGTTGEPTKIMMDKNAIYREWAFIYHYWSKFGYDYKSSRLATFRGVEMGKRISMINPLYAEIRLNPFILNFLNIDKYVRAIKKYKADYVYGYPSAIYNFCRIAKRKRIDLSRLFKGALFISENLYEFQEELIKDVLQCPIVIFYGHSERAVFAERYERGYIFNPYYGLTEINNKGKLIVTGFINPKTPLVRYLVDDYVSLVEDHFDFYNIQGNYAKALYGKTSNSFYKIEGHRDSELLLGNNGEQISAAAINFHDDTFLGISAYQFVQEELGKCIVKIVPENDFDVHRLNLITNRIENKLGDGFECEVKIVSSIPLTSRGKYRLFVQKIQKEN